MPQGLFSRHKHKGLRDFSLHLFVLNGFLPVLDSLSAHRALLHCPQTGTCLQPVPQYSSVGQCIYCISSGAAQCIGFVLMSGMTLHKPLFNQMGISGCLLEMSVQAHIHVQSSCATAHTFFFLAVIHLKNRSNPRSVPYMYRNQGIVLTLDVRF